LKVKSDPNASKTIRNGSRTGDSSSSTAIHFLKIKDSLDRKSYLAGALLIRRTRLLKRRLKLILQKLKEISSDINSAVVRSCKVFVVKNGLNLDEVTSIYQRIVAGSKAAYQHGKLSVAKYWLLTLLKGAGHFTAKAIRSPNYIMPVLASVVFLFTVVYTVNINFALKVTYNGESIAYIKDESIFEEAQKQMEGRIIFEEYIRPDDAIPQFSIAMVKENKVSNSNELTNLLIKSSGNELGEAYGLYVDDKFMGAVTDRRLIEQSLEQLLNSYRTEDPTEAVEFVQSTEIRGGLYPLSSIARIEELQQELRREEIAQRVYTAQSGDAPVTIAQKNNIPYSQLKALNPDIEKKLLVGQEVLVTKSVPTLGVKVTREVSEEEEVAFKINQVQDTSKYQGYVKVTQKGQKGKNVITSKVTYVDGVETERQIITTKVLSEPVNEVVVVGGKTPLAQIPTGAQSTSSNFRWPVDGGYLSCGINGYWGHTGMDIAANAGTAVRAAASGTVVLVKSSATGYGRHIMIDHGGGVQTLYAHNSKLLVSAGQWVEQGELIAQVGRTGRATGNHLHFEVRNNGRYLDPAKFIGTRYPY